MSIEFKNAHELGKLYKPELLREANRLTIWGRGAEAQITRDERTIRSLREQIDAQRIEFAKQRAEIERLEAAAKRTTGVGSGCGVRGDTYFDNQVRGCVNQVMDGADASGWSNRTSPQVTRWGTEFLSGMFEEFRNRVLAAEADAEDAHYKANVYYEDLKQAEHDAGSYRLVDDNRAADVQMLSARVIELTTQRNEALADVADVIERAYIAEDRAAVAKEDYDIVREEYDALLKKYKARKALDFISMYGGYGFPYSAVIDFSKE
jgi:hypothetical protein